MPQMAHVAVPADTWTELTNGDATVVSLQVVATGPIWIKGTAGSVAPTDLIGAFWIVQEAIEPSLNLAELFPGVAGVNRLWAFPGSDLGATVSVNHA